MEQIKEQLTDIKSMNMDELTEFIISLGEKKFRAKQIYEWIHVKHVDSFDEMTNISKNVHTGIKGQCNTHLAKKMRRCRCQSSTARENISFALDDGNVIEKCTYEVQAWKLCMHIFAGWLQDGVQILCIYS